MEDTLRFEVVGRDYADLCTQADARILEFVKTSLTPDEPMSVTYALEASEREVGSTDSGVSAGWSAEVTATILRVRLREFEQRSGA